MKRTISRRKPYGPRPKSGNGADHHRDRRRRVESLQAFLRLHGTGEDGRRARERFALRCGTTLPYLIHLGLGNRVASMELAVLIERESYGQVRAEDLHPSPHWNYLAHRPASPPPLPRKRRAAPRAQA